MSIRYRPTRFDHFDMFGLNVQLFDLTEPVAVINPLPWITVEALSSFFFFCGEELEATTVSSAAMAGYEGRLTLRTQSHTVELPTE
ncbi:hypothetical protein KY284_029915 [Solanum tuberosum]|nr:hypothetical protein KY284_029915 [Solanum tuberosum]